ncbi:hypothetical protein SprV_0802554800 [Sparganum proliferum]
MEEQPIASTSSVPNESPELQMPELMPEVSTELPVVAGTVDTVEGRCLTTDLREFCLRAKLSLTTAKDLFQVLWHYHPELPNDPKTLLQTPRTCVSKSLKRGKYVHLGLERGLLDELRLRTLTGIPEVHVQLHIDGMKVFKASAECLWPILARINHPVVGQPFVVGVFCGFGNPESLEDFLDDCVSELKGLLTTGLRDPRTESVIKVNLLNVICDTPARCYVRQVKAHNGYYGCHRHSQTNLRLRRRGLAKPTERANWLASSTANTTPLFAIHSVSPFHPIRALPFNLSVTAPVIYPNYLTSDRHRLVMSSDSTSQPIAGIHTFDLPSVWLGDIALWLRTVESRFALRQITREDTKFHYVVAALPMDIATDLRDIIDCPPTEAPYTALKEVLISRISLSTQKRLQRLISEEDLGDRKPTQLLRRLEQLADGQKLDATMFKQLFLQRLPPSVQAILAPNIPSSTVQTLAETADRILEYYQPPVTVNVASRSTIVPTIEDVVKRLDVLTLEVSQLRTTRGYNRRSPAITRRPRSPTPNQPTVDGFCWYHHNYGSNAHRCHSPCKYKTPASENSHADQ